MDAGKQSLLEFLGQNQQLTIPIYQRKYSWTEKECKQLLDDILRVGENTQENHFIGSVVYMNQKGHIAGPINSLMIIDGQQRTTTISLLISALSEFLKNNPNDNIMSADNLISYYLLNDRESGDLRYKLVLTDDDKSALIKIIDNLNREDKLSFDEEEDSIRIFDNYNYFLKNINEDNAEIIYNGLSKLLIIFVALEQNIDNPQLIFESLNSTGLELSQADLIRNYILMGLSPEEQEKLYNTYWHKLEKLFAEYKSEVFDKFIRDYLTVKLDRVPTLRNIYADFKLYSKTFDDIEILVKDVFKFAEYFSAIAFGKEKEANLKKALDSLKNLDYDVTYPFMLHLYQDYDEGKLNVPDFIEIIMYTESYLLRRLICSIPTPSLNKTFAKMYNEIDNKNYLESYKVALLLKENYQRMPDDEEFRRNWQERNIYDLRTKNKDYIFDKFENWNSKEKTIISNYTIEHILPQNPNLSKEWIDDLGPDYKDIQKKYLHTIGNLTLTGYNSELSDKPFIEKRDMVGGFKQSAIRLNIGLHDLEKWDEEEIQKRTNYLIGESFKIWGYPSVSDECLEKYKPKSSKKIKDESEYTENDKIYLGYWTKLRDSLVKDYPYFQYADPKPNTWYALYIGTRLAHIELTSSFIRSKKVNVHFRIKIDSNEIFDKLFENKEIIESEVGFELEWDRLDDKTISKIGKTLSGVDIGVESQWEESIKWQLDTAKKLYDVLLIKIKEFN